MNMTPAIQGAWRPQQEVGIVAGTPPGGGLDRLARALVRVIESQRLLEVPVKVTNIPGEGGRNAWTYVARHDGDPHVLSISSPNLTTDRLVGIAEFDYRAFTPLAIFFTEYIAFVARSDSPLKSAADLLQRAGTHAAPMTVALATARGNANHIALAKVIRHAGGDVKAPTIRVFDSALDAVADVAAGNADLGAISAVSAVKALAAGSLRALAVSAPQRLSGVYGQVPTWIEQSVDCVVGAWRGVGGAHGLTAAQVEFWERTFAAIAASREWRAELERHDWTHMYVDGARLGDYLERERTEMGALLKDLGLLKERAES